MGLEESLRCGIFSVATKGLKEANGEKAIVCIFVSKKKNQRRNFLVCQIVSGEVLDDDYII